MSTIILIIGGIILLVGVALIIYSQIGALFYSISDLIKEKNYKVAFEILLALIGWGILTWAIIEYKLGNIATMFIALLLLIPIGLLLYTSLKNK